MLKGLFEPGQLAPAANSPIENSVSVFPDLRSGPQAPFSPRLIRSCIHPRLRSSPSTESPQPCLPRFKHHRRCPSSTFSSPNKRSKDAGIERYQAPEISSVRLRLLPAQPPSEEKDGISLRSEREQQTERIRTFAAMPEVLLGAWSAALSPFSSFSF
mgnify:CR=1